MLKLYIEGRSQEGSVVLQRQYEEIFLFKKIRNNRQKKLDLVRRFLVEKFAVPEAEALALDLSDVYSRVYLELRRLIAWEKGLEPGVRFMAGKLGPFTLEDITDKGFLVVKESRKLFSPKGASVVKGVH